MKPLFVILFLPLCIATAQTLKYDNAAIGQIVHTASFEFANYKLYENENEWKGKTVSVSGIYYPNRIFARAAQVMINIAGNSAFGPVNVAVYLDGPLPTVINYGQETPALTPGQNIRIVGTIKRTEQFISWDGYQMVLPSVDCIAIYRKDDADMQYPMWVSKAFKR